MSALDRLIGDPVTFLLLSLVWATVAVWLVTFLMWSIMGDVEIWAAFLGAGGMAGLGFIASKPPNPAVMWAAGIFVIISLPLYPGARKMINGRQNALIELERMERAYDTLLLRPHNPGAALRIAEALFARGYIALAASVGEEAMIHLPRNLYDREYKMVQGWKAQAKTNGVPELVCPLCGERNEARDVLCSRCRGPYLLAYARGAWAPAGISRILAGWLGGACLTIGIPAVASSSIPEAGKAVLIFAMAGAAVLVLILSLAKVFDR